MSRRQRRRLEQAARLRARQADSRLRLIYDTRGPAVRLGLIWAGLLAGALWLGGGVRGAALRRPRRHRRAADRAGMAGGGGPPAPRPSPVRRHRGRLPARRAGRGRRAGLRHRGIGGGLPGRRRPAGTRAHARRGHRGALAICTASITLRCGFFAGLAAGCVVLVHREDAAAALVLILLVCSYEAGDYLVGSGSTTVVEGPAAGCIGVLVATFAVSVVRPDLFGGAGEVWAVGVATAPRLPARSAGGLGRAALGRRVRAGAAAPRLLPAGRAGVGPGPPRRLAGGPSTATLRFMATPPEGLRPLYARVVKPARGGRLDERSLGELRTMRTDCEQAEAAVSFTRRVLHGRLDLLASEQERRREPAPADPLVPPLRRRARRRHPSSSRSCSSGCGRVLVAQSWPARPRPRRLVVTPAPECVSDDLLQLVDDVAGPAVLTELSGQSDEQMATLRRRLPAPRARALGAAAGVARRHRQPPRRGQEALPAGGGDGRAPPRVSWAATGRPRL